jgi:ribosome-binding protein aMBF1 (putative translation factor)
LDYSNFDYRVSANPCGLATLNKTVHSEEYRAVLRVLQAAREEAGLTQEQLALRLGETQSFVSKVERGERRLDIVELRHIGRALGLTLLELAERIERLLSARTQ